LTNRPLDRAARTAFFRRRLIRGAAIIDFGGKKKKEEKKEREREEGVSVFFSFFDESRARAVKTIDCGGKKSPRNFGRASYRAADYFRYRFYAIA